MGGATSTRGRGRDELSCRACPSALRTSPREVRPEMSRIRVGVVGCGYWGPNLIRNFASCTMTEGVAACDASAKRLEANGRNYGHLALVDSVDRLLELPLDAVAIATPVSTHFPLARRCLEAGLHVLVEKPLAATVAEAEALIELAGRLGRVLMV